MPVAGLQAIYRYWGEPVVKHKGILLNGIVDYNVDDEYKKAEQFGAMANVRLKVDDCPEAIEKRDEIIIKDVVYTVIEIGKTIDNAEYIIKLSKVG